MVLFHSRCKIKNQPANKVSPSVYLPPRRMSHNMSRDTADEFAVLFEHLRDEDFETNLGPAILRALRRSASRCMPTVAQILSLCRSDMSVSGPEMVSVLVDSTKSADLLEDSSRSIGLVFWGSRSSKSRLEILEHLHSAFPRFGQQAVDVAVSRIMHELLVCRLHKEEVSDDVLRFGFTESPLVGGLLKQLKSGASEETKCIIASAIGDVLGFLASSSPTTTRSFIIDPLKDTLIPFLSDKKSAVGEPLKSAVMLAVECVAQFDTTGILSGDLVSVDTFLPYMSLLIQGRQTAQSMCLASWAVVLHSGIEDSRLTKLYSQAVVSDSTFGTHLGEDTPEIRRLLRSVAKRALANPAFPVYSNSEVETIVLPTPIRTQNRFCANLIDIIATQSWAKLEIPEHRKSDPVFCTRMVMALYEAITAGVIPGRLLRIALEKVFELTGLSSEWTGLLVVMAHHPVFASHQTSVATLWRTRLMKVVNTNSIDDISGWILQCARITSETDGFRKAAISAVRALVGMANNDQVEAFVKLIIRLVDTKAIVNIDASQLGIFFCVPTVVWTENADNAWIPSEENTLKVEAPVVKTGGKSNAPKQITKQDMMRDSLKEQSIVRQKVATIAASVQFAIQTLSVLVELSVESAKSFCLERMTTDFIRLINSPLTGHSASKLVNQLDMSVLRSGKVATLMRANSLVTNIEDWTEFLSLVETRGSLSSAEFAVIEPLVSIGLAPATASQFGVAKSLLRLLADKPACAIENILRPVLAGICQTAPGVFAIDIGSYLRAASGRIVSESELELVLQIAASSEETKLFFEVVSGVNGVNTGLYSSSIALQTLILLAAYGDKSREVKDSRLTELVGSFMQSVDSGVMVEKLISLLSGPQVVPEYAAETLAWVVGQTGFGMVTVLSKLTSGFMGTTSESHRAGLALGLESVSKITTTDAAYVVDMIEFVLGTGIPASASETVRDTLLRAASETISNSGEPHALTLIAICENHIGSAESGTAVAAPVLLGLLCKYLPADNPKAETVRTKLVGELLTAPQVAVQRKIASVLPPLLKMSNDVPKYLETFLNTALCTSDVCARFGAAMGVGAAAKAQGVSILRQMEVLKRVQDAAEDKSSTDKRQGAIAVYGGLSSSLGRLFEPYVSQVLPVLLVSFGDNQAAVRDAARDAAEQIMGNLSTHGIKLVLPSLLAGVNDMQWRTKLGSIKLLSAMVHCAPKALAASLPKIVPALAEVATDTHIKVKDAACSALEELGGVINNPEIKACAAKLIAAVTDPANDNKRNIALDTLLATSFVHSIDAASLSLVVPVVLRATRERGSEMKKKGAQILGSIAILSADPVEGLGPYMARIVPALEEVLVDPSPDVRATAAKALGTMARALPEIIVTEVLPWLFTTLKQAQSQVERSGAAQGLSEVLVELGSEQFMKILPEIVTNAGNPATPPEAREGYMGLFVFLPGVMKAAFAPHIEHVFPVLIQGLSDSLQSVREVAQRAASAICAQFAQSHATLLLPSLERGLFAKDARARQASIQLCGLTLEQLMKVGRTSENLLDNSAVPLTAERRSYMLAMLYIVRSDPNQSVNQCAQQVWKNVVSNTPRTLRLILPILVRLLIVNLSSTEEETRQLLAGRCLGDLVGKLGERVLPDLMPILTETMQSNDPMTRAGVCIGLSEIVNASHRQLLQEYFSILFPAIKKGLTDESSIVRDKASVVVGTMYQTLGNTTVNSIVPSVIEMILSPESAVSESGINGLNGLVRALPRELLPIVMDTLATEPFFAQKIAALETLVAAPQLEVAKHATQIVNYLVDGFALFPAESVHCANVLFAQFNRHSCHLAMMELVKGLENAESGGYREASASLIGACIKHAPMEVVSEYADAIVSLLMRMVLADQYQPAMECALESFSELTNKFSKDVMVKYMKGIAGSVREHVAASTASGLALPATFSTLWPIYQHALMFGNVEAKEIAANGLTELVSALPLDRLKPNAIKVTGPLIRVLGEKYPSSVRVAILRSLQVLIQRLDVALKPFLPQLQTTYQKCAQDSDEAVQTLAEESMELLAKLSAPK
jgi:HEAT repeat protein